MSFQRISEQDAEFGSSRVAAIVLAAGAGTRMRSVTPKLLHEIAGLPLIGHVMRALAPIEFEQTVVVIGYGGEQIRSRLGSTYYYVNQTEQLGTGHAVLQARARLEGQAATILVTYGDVPLISSSSFQDLVYAHQTQRGAQVTVLTCVVPDPSGYGRIIRNTAGHIIGIVEEKVATASELTINEINVGAYCFDSTWLWPRLAQLVPHPGTIEYFLTDIVSKAAEEEPGRVQGQRVLDPREAIGINNLVQLGEADSIVRDRLRSRWMLNGVTMIDPQSTYIDMDIVLGHDTVLYPGCYLRGSTRIGEACRLGPQAHLIDSTIGDRCIVGSSLLEGCVLESDVEVGPFHHLPTGTYISHGTRLRNFTQIEPPIETAEKA